MLERLADAARASVVSQGQRLRAQLRAGAFGAPAAPQRVSAMRLAVGTLPIFVCFVAIVLRDGEELRFASEELRDGLAASLLLDRALVALMFLAQLGIWAAVHFGGPDAVLIIARLTVWCYYIIPGGAQYRGLRAVHDVRREERCEVRNARHHTRPESSAARSSNPDTRSPRRSR